jgi:CelD/BcsL family acetyltransferase involved in cellulose biosynthesis
LKIINNIIDGKYTIKQVTELGEFTTLRDVWDRLAEKQGGYTPFLCFDWFKIWLKHFLRGNNLLIILVYDEGALKAIAPFIIKNDIFKGIFKIKKIELIGNVHSPIRNFIFAEFEDNIRLALLYKMFNFLKSEYKDWDALELESIPEELDSVSFIKNAVEQVGLKGREYSCFNDWTLEDINYSGDEYMRRRPKNLRKELGKRRRRLERNGELRFVIESDRKSYDYYKKVYDEVRKKSWKHAENDIGFLDDFRRTAFEKGWLRFASLYFNSSPISCHLRLDYKNEVYFLESVYDKEYAEYSPTTILRSELMKYVIDKEKVINIHTIKGDEAYKKDWTPKRRRRIGFTIFNDTPRGQVLVFLMTKVLPIVEKNPTLLKGKNGVMKYLKRRSRIKEE